MKCPALHCPACKTSWSSIEVHMLISSGRNDTDHALRPCCKLRMYQIALASFGRAQETLRHQPPVRSGLKDTCENQLVLFDERDYWRDPRQGPIA